MCGFNFCTIKDLQYLEDNQYVDAVGIVHLKSEPVEV